MLATACEWDVDVELVRSVHARVHLEREAQLSYLAWRECLRSQSERTGAAPFDNLGMRLAEGDLGV